MKNFLPYLTLQASHQKQLAFLMFFISLVYFHNFYINDIWTPNESFYAEAVREMFESENYLEFYYNYEPRYKKPPLTYWAMAISAGIFGMNEFALRLPILLMGLGSIWLTYLIGKLLYGHKGGLYSMVMVAFTLQFIAVKQYASPEMPLTFFFTLTLYWFLKGYKSRTFRFVLLSYISLGLTVLTKGFPYIVVIGGIIGLYLLWENWGNWKQLWKDIRFLKLQLGIPLVAIIGLSWIIFMYVKDGNEFWTVYKFETLDRAFTRETNGLRPLFYWEVMTWTIIPYSLCFFFALIYWVRNWRKSKEVAFAMSWFVVMLVIFTASKGKLPTYFIQAHPALILIITPLLLNANFRGLTRLVWYISFGLVPILLTVASFYFIYIVDLSPFLYLLPLMGLIGFVFWIVKRKTVEGNVALPFWCMGVFILVFASYFPKMETFRPYDTIGHVINQKNAIDKSIPLFIENTLIHNIPFYAEREVIDYAAQETIASSPKTTLALIKSINRDQYEGFETLWEGKIYDSPSESQFFKFAMACIGAENGDFSKFADFSLIFRP